MIPRAWEGMETVGVIPTHISYYFYYVDVDADFRIDFLCSPCSLYVTMLTENTIRHVTFVETSFLSHNFQLTIGNKTITLSLSRVFAVSVTLHSYNTIATLQQRYRYFPIPNLVKFYFKFYSNLAFLLRRNGILAHTHTFTPTRSVTVLMIFNCKTAHQNSDILRCNTASPMHKTPYRHLPF